jgi:hypothetical protein
MSIHAYGKKEREEEYKPARHYENQGPHVSKAARLEEEERAGKKIKIEMESNAFVQLVSPDGEVLGPQVTKPAVARPDCRSQCDIAGRRPARSFTEAARAPCQPGVGACSSRLSSGPAPACPAYADPILCPAVP